MQTLASLGLLVDSREVGTGVTRLNDLTSAGKRAEVQSERLSASHRTLEARTQGAATATRLLGNALGVVATVAAADQVRRLADGYTIYTNQLKVAGLEGAALTSVQDKLFGQAQKYGVELKSLGTLYGRVSQSSKELGATQTELQTFTNGVAAALKVQGGAASESSGALLQLSQLLGSAKVQAQEFNSINDGARPILQAVANGNDKYAGSVARLRAAVIDGKVTNREFFDDFLEGSKQLEEQATKANLTIGNSFTVLNNAVGRFVGQQDQQLSATQTISAGIIGLSKNLDTVAQVGTAAAVVFGARWAASGAVFVQTEIARTAALAGSITAERASAVSAAQTALARNAARVTDLEATGASITLARQEATARLATANAIIASESGVVAATARVTAAERTRSVALAELALLGRQAAGVNGQIAVTSQAAAVAQAELAVASRAAGGAMVTFRTAGSGLLGFLGGPWGVAFIAAGAVVYGLYKALAELKVPSAQVTAATTQLSTATDAYRIAADAASTASGTARVTALQEAAAKRELAIQARDAAKAQLAQAQATLALVAAETARAANSAGNPFNPANDPDVQVGVYQGLAKRETKAKTDAAAVQAKLADANTAIGLADRVLNAPVAAPPPDATGKIDRHAAALGRDLEAMKATASANFELAAAYGISDEAALRSAARSDAVGQAIKRQGDISKFVAATLLLNASKVAVDTGQQVADLRFQADAQKALNAQVAAGTITSDQAAEQLDLENRLRPAIAASTLLEGAAKTQLLGIIKDLGQATKDANDAARQSRLLAENGQGADELALLERQLTLIGATNRERAVSLAQLQAEQELKRDGFKPGDVGYADKVTNAGKRAGLTDDVQTRTENANKALVYQLDLLGQIDNQAQDMAGGLAAAFGSVGASVGALTTLLTDYAKTQEEIAVRRAAYIKDGGDDERRIALFNAESTRAQVKNYGDLAEVTGSFFSKKSAAYKVAQAAERSFRLVELALSVQSMLQRTTEVGVVATTEAAKTAIEVPAAGVRASAKAAEGIAGIFATLGPFAFPVAAAAVAVMAAAGVSILGGGGGATPGANDQKNRQAAQGAGTVLGDSTAKSDSLTKAASIAEANQNKDLQYSSAMVTSLRSIDSNISTLTAAVARALNVGGALDTSGLDLGTSTKGPGLSRFVNPIAFLLPGLFGSKTTTSLQDQGLRFDDQSLASILGGGLQGESYAQTLTQTKKKFFGITYSNKAKSSTTAEELDADLKGDITRVIASLEAGVVAAAGVIGITGAKATLDALTISLGTISLKDLKGSELNDALNAVFGKVADEMAGALLTNISSFQQAGEGAFETLTRLAHDYQTVDVTLQSIGKTFGAVGISSLAAREHLVELVGGLDNLVQMTSDFADNFLTDAEKLAPIAAAVTAAMSKLGFAGVTTKDAFKDLVLGIDVSTAAGAELYGQLLAIAPAFAKVADAVKDAVGEIASITVDDLKDAYTRQASVLTGTISTLTALQNGLRKYEQQLNSGPQARLSPTDQLAATRADFASTYGQALGGNQDAIGSLSAVGDAFLAASKEYNASTEAYFADLRTVKDAIAAVSGSVGSQLSSAQKELNALDSMVNQFATANGLLFSVKDGVITLNKSTLSVLDAIKQLILQSKMVDPAKGPGAANDNYIQKDTNIPGVTGANNAIANNQHAIEVAQAQMAAATKVGDAAGAAIWAKAIEAHQQDINELQARIAASGQKFATGAAFSDGIVTRPTMFNRDQMAEVGPEAIMPLANINGSLGVRVTAPPARNDDQFQQAMLAELRAGNRQRAAVATKQAADMKDLRAEFEAMRREVARRPARAAS